MTSNLSRINLRTILVVIGVGLYSVGVLAEPVARPRVALVLGGGGARGSAHIGVLQVLEENRIPVDCIAGTSMGALVSGAFASGLKPDEMLTMLDQADWHKMFK
ncbi:MAG: patatin-like phospholipase family protein, partial [Burkholderiales bacterium]